MDDVVLIGALNNITSACGLLAAMTPSGAPQAMQLLNAAKNLYDPPPPPPPPEEVQPVADPAAEESHSSGRRSRSSE